MVVGRCNLKIPIESPGGGIHCDDGVRIEVIARTYTQVKIGCGVSNGTKEFACPRIERESCPEAPTRWRSGVRPGFPRGVIGTLRDGMKAPKFLAGLGVEGDQAAVNSQVADGYADENFAFPADRSCDERLILGGIGTHYVPQHLARRGIEGNHATVSGAAEDHPVEVTRPATPDVCSPTQLQNIAPSKLTGCSINGIGGAQRGDVKCAPHHQQTAAEPTRLIQLSLADLFKCAHIRWGNLVQVDIPLAGIVFIDCDPIMRLLGRNRGAEAAHKKSSCETDMREIARTPNQTLPPFPFNASVRFRHWERCGVVLVNGENVALRILDDGVPGDLGYCGLFSHHFAAHALDEVNRLVDRIHRNVVNPTARARYWAIEQSASNGGGFGRAGLNMEVVESSRLLDLPPEEFFVKFSELVQVIAVDFEVRHRRGHVLSHSGLG